VNNFKSEEEPGNLEEKINGDFDSNNKTFPLQGTDNKDKFKSLKILRKSPAKSKHKLINYSYNLDNFPKNNSSITQENNAA
jgi:hypothetical protein